MLQMHLQFTHYMQDMQFHHVPVQVLFDGQRNGSSGLHNMAVQMHHSQLPLSQQRLLLTVRYSNQHCTVCLPNMALPIHRHATHTDTDS